MHYPERKDGYSVTVTNIVDIIDIDFDEDTVRSETFGLYRIHYAYIDDHCGLIDNKCVTVGCVGSEVKYDNILYTSENMNKLYSYIKTKNIARLLEILDK